MSKSPFGYLFVLAICAILSSTASAQQGGATGATTGQATTGAGATTGGEQAATALNADEAFAGIQRGATVGATAGTGQGFGIGATASTTTRGGGGGGGFGGLGGLGGFGGLNSLFGGGAAGQNTKSAIRTRLRSAVQGNPISPQQVQQSASSRLQTLPASNRINGVNVTMEGRTAIVTGVVNSDRDRRMSELLMRLEPGVSRVENRVIISP